MKTQTVNTGTATLVDKKPKRRTVTITMGLDIAETLHGFIDGAIGTSESDDFNEQMIPLRDKLTRRIKKHYTN